MKYLGLRPLNVPLWILILTIALMTMGLIAVYSASATVAGAEQRHSAAGSRKLFVAGRRSRPGKTGTE